MLDIPARAWYYNTRKRKDTSQTRKGKKMKKTTTAREMRFIVKSAIDQAIAELATTYGIEALQSKTVGHILETEATCAVAELAENGAILSLRQREGWGKTAE